jgi:hypothetical protein
MSGEGVVTVRRVFFRTAAILLALLWLYVWFGIAWINGWFQPWVYEVLS